MLSPFLRVSDLGKSGKKVLTSNFGTLMGAALQSPSILEEIFPQSYSDKLPRISDSLPMNSFSIDDRPRPQMYNYIKKSVSAHSKGRSRNQHDGGPR
jgi:hypothetical protein